MAEVIAGRYALGDLIGRGGMARVVAGRDLRLDRDVAVKLVPADTIDDIDPVGRERFVREARSSAGFHHPHAVAVFDAGLSDGYLYLVMELVTGPSLATVVAEQGPLDVDEAVRIASEVLEALAAAHRAGIVHRDVKPGNVLMTPSGDVKLADFGIAKRLDEVSGDLTSTGQFIGTPKYLAPEQVAGGPVTGAADLYSTGVLLFEMLAGAPPFEASTPVATAIAHRDAPVPDLTQRRPDVPAHVVDAVTRALAKDPAERFASADQMRAALTGSTSPVLAPPALAAVAPIATVPPTMTMPSAPPPLDPTAGGAPDRSVGARRAWWLAALTLMAAAVAVFALADRDDATQGTDTRGAPGPRQTAEATRPANAATAAATSPATPAATAAPPTTAPPPTTTAPATVPATEPPPEPPATLDELIAFLGSDPGTFGESGPELLDDLNEVLEREGAKQAEEAQKLIDSIGEWEANGELAPGIAPLAIGILEPLAAGPGNGNGNGNGDGNGDEEEGDD